jgi:hypothetical protein
MLNTQFTSLAFSSQQMYSNNNNLTNPGKHNKEPGETVVLMPYLSLFMTVFWSKMCKFQSMAVHMEHFAEEGHYYRPFSEYFSSLL